MILVGKFGWDRDSSHGPSRRHPGLRLYTSREPQGRAPYYKELDSELASKGDITSEVMLMPSAAWNKHTMSQQHALAK